MGITKKSLDRLHSFGCLQKGTKMLELGAQNIYDNENYGKVAKDVFTEMGVNHTSIDIKAHQGALEADLREPIKLFKNKFDVVTDFGTCEHIDGSLYQGFLNIHNLCRKDGLMVHENPKTGNWPKHGNHYFTKAFYEKLAELNGYELEELTEESAMGNSFDGWNICAVIQKKNSNKFISEEEFNKLDFRKS